MTIQLPDGGQIGRTLLTDGSVQLYATKLWGEGMIWSVTRDYDKIFTSRVFSKALDAYHGLAKEVFKS